MQDKPDNYKHQQKKRLKFKLRIQLTEKMLNYKLGRLRHL